VRSRGLPSAASRPSTSAVLVAIAKFGVPGAAPSTTRALRYHVDWTGQARRLAGPLGTAVPGRTFDPDSVVLLLSP
jgi:hypothetical protein